MVSIIQGIKEVSLAEKLPESKVVMETPVNEMLVTKPWPEVRSRSDSKSTAAAVAVEETKESTPDAKSS